MTLAHTLAFACGSLAAFAFCFAYLWRLESTSLLCLLAAREAARRTGYGQGWDEAVAHAERERERPVLPAIQVPRVLQGRHLKPWHAGKPGPHSVQWALMLDDTDDAEAENLSHEVARYFADLHDHFARPGIPKALKKADGQPPASAGMRLPHGTPVTA